MHQGKTKNDNQLLERNENNWRKQEKRTRKAALYTNI